MRHAKKAHIGDKQTIIFQRYKTRTRIGIKRKDNGKDRKQVRHLGAPMTLYQSVRMCCRFGELCGPNTIGFRRKMQKLLWRIAVCITICAVAICRRHNRRIVHRAVIVMMRAAGLPLLLFFASGKTARAIRFNHCDSPVVFAIETLSTLRAGESSGAADFLLQLNNAKQ